MTYNLQEFKAWLEADESRKDRLNWNEIFPSIRNKFAEFVKKEGSFGTEYWKYSQAVVQKWKTEVDRKELLGEAFPEIERLKTQLAQLQAEKTTLQEKMLGESEQKDTFQKSADYLRETLKGVEKRLEKVKKELEEEKEKNKELTKSQETEKESHQTELKNRSEAYGVIQERNQELEKKLSGANSEIQQLTTWIGKLEAVSADGNALASLKKELESAQLQIIALTEELQAKKPRSYWWVYVVIALVAVYLVMG